MSLEGDAQGRLWAAWPQRGLALGVLCALGAVEPAVAGELVVVRSGDHASYRTAAQAFSTAMGRTVASMSLADPATAAALPTAVAQSEVVLALGSDAARTVAALRPNRWLYAQVQDPVAAGLEPSVPGIPMYVSPSRQLEVLRRLTPSVQRLGIVYNASASKAVADASEGAAKDVGLKLFRSEVTSAREVAPAVKKLLAEVDVLWLLPDATTLSAESFRFIVQSSIASRKIVLGFSEGMTKAGATLSLEATPEELGQRAATLARQLIAGTPPPAVEPPTGVLSINARAAALIGHAVSDSLRQQATRVFE
jgi:putative ABC transport system substrate-binding protein